MKGESMKTRASVCLALAGLLALSFAATVGPARAEGDESLLDDAQKAAGDAWDATTEGASDAWDATKEGAGDAWDATKETSSDVWDATKEGTEELYEDAKDAIE